jgi:hypothetical protein
MGSFLERLHVESVPGLYCIPPEGAPTLLEGELASDIIYLILAFLISREKGRDLVPAAS